MPNLKDIKRSIASVKNTRQITKAMKLVAAAKLRRAQEAVEAARPYASKMVELMTSIAARSDSESHPLLSRRDVENILIVVLTGDKGLCGPFNNSILKTAQQIIEENEGKGIHLLLVGKKSVDFFRRRPFKIIKSIVDYGKRVNNAMAEEIAGEVMESFISEKADVVYLVYNKFKNVVVQEPQAVSLLPLELPPVEEGSQPQTVDYEYEPSANEILDDLLKSYVVSHIYHAMLESAASEHGARMTAMDAATRNASEMIAELTLKYNRARQAAITTELIEVVAGADALEG
ncbi:MAG TPA: ATP synthase F1 subunit gamma [Nitrospirae bacterium]|nr:ATP synthase F1 subunit gamma [Nitrospirota bacterium]